MANQAEQNIVHQFTQLLKKNPNLLASVLPTAASVVRSNDQQSGARKADDNITEQAENGRVFGSYSAEDLLNKRSKNGKGSEAQQTFRVSLSLLN